MAKRANPYADDFIPQSKVHVNLKHLNNNEDRLKKVYEKTLELLFKGAKKGPTLDALNNNDINFPKKEEKMKQLFIGTDGSLLHSGCLKELRSPGRCACAPAAAAECACADCEAALCARCERRCRRCLRPHCAHCLLLGPEDTEVCMSCYT